MEEDIRRALTVLRSGGTILYPTDTIWGIGCDATNQKAVNSIYKIKKIKGNKNMLVLLDSPEKISRYVKILPDIAMEIINKSGKPVTIIFPNAINIASDLIAPDGSIGIRISNDPFCRNLISRFDKPVVSTSANISGKSQPQYYQEIDQEIRNSVDYIVKWKQADLSKSSASKIIKIEEQGEITVIRE